MRKSQAIVVANEIFCYSAPPMTARPSRLNTKSSAAPARRSFRDRMRRVWRITKWTVFLLGLLAIGAGWYGQKLTTWAEEHFSRSFRWNIPSRVYSDGEYLFPGLDLARRDLPGKLDRLGYRNTGTTITTPGDYSVSKDTIEIFLHDFDYPQQKFKGFPVRLTVSDSVITAITHLQTNQALPTLRLEPELIASLFDARMEDRTLITLKEVPDVCLQAVVLIEDERFFEHHGVDPTGIFRAMLKNLASFRIKQGGSTLTQQLVKNYFLDQERSFKRKIKEAIIALAIEQRHSKKEILEAYLNEIYLGQRGQSSVEGIGEAAHLYFAKNVNQLTIGECALLAGMIRSPHHYSPFNDPQAATDRRDFVLKRLEDVALITPVQYASARAEKIVTPIRPKSAVQAPYFIDFVKQQLHILYPETQLTAEGMRIFTTLDMTSQRIAESAVEESLAALETQYAKTLPPHPAGPLQGVLISVQPQTGYLRALVGGRSYSDTQFNRAIQAKRQPGSIFKPFVYLTAFDPSRTKTPIAPSTFIYDVGFHIQSGGEDWAPRNYDHQEHGPLPAHDALMKSYNIATARLAIDTGLPAIVQTAHDAGIAAPLQAVPALALGAFEVTPLEMTSAYTIFPNNGLRAEPLSIMQVVTTDGRVLERKTISMQRQFDPAPVYLVTQTLKDVLNFGTAASSRRLGFSGLAAGKTGTTSSYRDAWFVGFTPDIVTLTWVGYDDNATIKLSGGQAALPMWVRYTTASIGNPQQDFAVPKNIVMVKIDPESGKIATKNCPQTIFAPFVEGAEPREACPLH